MYRLVLIDGKNFAYRAHYSHLNLSSRGRPTSVLYGGLSAMLTLAQKVPGAALAFVWDSPEKTWRHALSGGTYKANRKFTKEKADIARQIVDFRDFLQHVGFRDVEVPALEADDVIGLLVEWLAKEKGDWFDEVIVHSTDRDYYQLLRYGSQVRILGKDGFVDSHSVFKKFGVQAVDWVKFRALTGDPTDNIPSVRRGVGPKTAVRLLEAGVDPKVHRFEALDQDVQKEFGSFRKDWSKAHRNYRLSKLLSLSDLREERITGLDEGHIWDELMNRFVERERFYRDRVRVTEHSYRWALGVLADYEMNEMLALRHRFWRLP